MSSVIAVPAVTAVVASAVNPQPTKLKPGISCNSGKSFGIWFTLIVSFGIFAFFPFALYEILNLVFCQVLCH